MKVEKKNIFKDIRIVVPIVIIVMIAAAGFMIRSYLKDTRLIGELDKEWIISVDNGLKKSITLPQEKYKYEKNSVILMETVLPEDFKEAQVICIKANMAAVRVFLDDRIIYGEEKEGFPILEKLPIHIRKLIDIEEGSDGKKLGIEFRTTNAEQVSKLSEIIYGDLTDVLKFVVIKTSFFRVLSVVIIMLLGFELIIVYAVFHKRLEAKGILYSGCYMVLMGLWELTTESGMLSFNRFSYSLNYYLCLGTCCIMALFFILSLRETVPASNKKILSILIYGFSCNIGLWFLLNIFCENVVIKFTVPLVINVVLIVLSILYIFYYNIGQLRIKGALTQPGMKAIFLFSVIILLGLISWPFVGFSIMILVFQTAGALYAIFIAYTNARQVVEESQRSKKVQAELLEVRNQLALSQIQPSFMENTLNQIQELILDKPDEAYELVYSFANFLRYNIDSVDTDNYKSFADELKNIRNYIKIESKRLKDCLSIEYGIETMDFNLPSLSIQLLIELAVLQGQELQAEKIHIVIRSYETAYGFAVQIEENNGAFTKKGLDGNEKVAKGLKNICVRWNYMTGGSIRIEDFMKKGSCLIAEILTGSEKYE